MKTRFAMWIMLPILLLLQTVYPVCFAAAIYADMDFQVYHPEVFAVVTVTLMLAATVLVLRCKPVWCKWYDFCCYFLLPCAIINGTRWFCLEQLSMHMTIMAVWNVTCALVLFWHSAGRWKLIAGIFSGLVAVQAIVACGLGLIVSLDPIPSITVMGEYPSPDGTYTAQVVVRDWEDRVNLSEEIRVELYDHSWDVELLIGKICLHEKKIYSDKWRDESITVRWLDEDTLLIDGKTYDIQ